MAIVTVCGAECGINVTGSGPSTDRHWTGANMDTTTVDTGVFRSGSKSYKVLPKANGFASFARTHASSKTISYARVYFRFSSVTLAATTTVVAFGSAAGSISIQVVSGGQVRTGGGSIQNGPIIVADTWYGIEGEFDCSANPFVLKWRTWDSGTNSWTSWTNSTRALAASTISTLAVGNQGPTTGTVAVYLDDIVIGEGTVAGEDFDSNQPKGGKVLRYLPTSDGTHSFTAGDFGYDAAGADVGLSDSTVYQRLDDDDQTSLSDFIRQKVIRTTGYVEVGFADESTETNPRAVAVTSVFHSSSTLANTISVKASDNAFTSTTNILTDSDVSDTTLHTRHAVMSTPPSGGSWTTAKVNSLTARAGYSSDVTDIPYIDNISLEVEWDDPLAVSQDPTGERGFFGI